MYISPEELSTILDALAIAGKVKMNEFDLAQGQADVVSQQRAIRAAREVRRMHKLLKSIKEDLDYYTSEG